MAKKRALKDESQISRQARWQRKHRALGLCVLCSLPAYKGWRCEKHYEQHKIAMRLRYIPKVRGRYKVGGVDFAKIEKEHLAKKKAAGKKTTVAKKKPAVVKAAPKKVAPKKAVAKKAVAKKAAPKKVVAKKAAPAKPVAKKKAAAKKKPAGRRG